MIVLIGGGTHTGKTLAAQRLLERYAFPYLSMDHLKMGLIRSGICSLSPECDDRVLMSYLWKIVKEIIKTVMENNQNLVVEGCYIPPDWTEDFTSDNLKQIRYVCLIFSEDYIRKHYADILRHANVIEQRLDDTYCTEILLLDENKANLQMCLLHGYDYILIDGVYQVDIHLGD